MIVPDRKISYTYWFQFNQENWLPPVIQATWEARTMGWLKVERLMWILWPHYGPEEV